VTLIIILVDLVSKLASRLPLRRKPRGLEGGASSRSWKGIGWLWPRALTSVDRPHDAECRAADLVEGLPARDHLPQDDAPAEHVTLLTVVNACEHTQTHTHTWLRYIKII